MGGGGSKTTNNTYTGLGDDQYTNLKAGQTSLGTQIEDVNTAAQDRFNQADTALAGLATGQAGLGTQLTDTQNQIASGFTDAATQVSGIGDQVTGVSDQITGLGTDIGNQFSDLNVGMTNAFADQTSNINANVDARFGTMQEAMGNQFENTNQNIATGFETANTNLQNAAQGINTSISDARTDINQNLNTGFENTQNQLTEAQKAIIAGQGGIGEQLTQVGGNLDAYYSGLAAQNAEALANQGTLQTSLNDYVNQYGKDVKTAQDQRNELVQGVTSGFDSVRDGMAVASDAATAERMALAQQVTGVGQNVAEAQMANESNFSDIAKQIAVGFDDGTQQSAEAKQDFVNRLNTVRDVLATQGDQLDSNIRDQYGKMASSFDESGALISRSLDQQGNTIGRALDAQGNLLLATFDQTGQRIDQQSLNLNQMMNQLDMLGYVQTSGTASGSLSPQMLAQRPAQAVSGLASPFTSTR